MKSRLLTEKERRRTTITLMYLVMQYHGTAKKLGVIFAHGLLHKLVSEIFVYGVSVGITYVENGQFIVYKVNVTENTL